jgi:heme exporter protein C
VAGLGIGKRQAFLLFTAAFFLVDLYLILIYAPTLTDALGNELGRMVYVHPPLAITGLVSAVVAAVASVVYLTKRSSKWDRIAWAAVEVGTVFFTAAVVTGAIWAKPVWQRWWVWDANGTLTFMLWLVFISYLIVRAYAPTRAQGARWSATVAIFGAAAAPFVYMAGDWWVGVHTERVTGPGAAGSLEGPISNLFNISLLAFICLFAALLAERSSQRGLEEEIDTLRKDVS